MTLAETLNRLVALIDRLVRVRTSAAATPRLADRSRRLRGLGKAPRGSGGVQALLAATRRALQLPPGYEWPELAGIRSSCTGGEWGCCASGRPPHGEDRYGRRVRHCFQSSRLRPVPFGRGGLRMGAAKPASLRKPPAPLSRCASRADLVNGLPFTRHRRQVSIRARMLRPCARDRRCFSRGHCGIFPLLLSDASAARGGPRDLGGCALPPDRRARGGR